MVSISLHKFYCICNYINYIHLLLFSMYSCILTLSYPSVFSGYGSSGDARIYNASEFLEMVQDGSIGFPDPQPFPNDTVDMPFFLVGDDAFSLSENMQKPYGHRVLTREERILNYRLSRARRVSENAFGILANRFQVIIVFSKRNFIYKTIVHVNFLHMTILVFCHFRYSSQR